MNDDVYLQPRHYLIVPSNRNEQDILQKIDMATRNRLLESYHLNVNSQYLTTFACVYVEALITTVGAIIKSTNEDATINFFNLFAVTANNRVAENADKEGNINISFIPATVTKSILEQDFAPVIDPEQWQSTIINEVEKCAARILSTKHKASADKAYVWTIIAYEYFHMLIRYMKMAGRTALENGKRTVFLNFLDMIEFHHIMESVANPDNPEIVAETCVLKMLPGFQAKILVKSDTVTERDEL